MQDFVRYGVTSKFDLCDCMGVDQEKELFIRMLQKEHYAQALHPAASGACRGSQKHAKKQYVLGKRGPLFKIGRDIPGGRNDGDHLERPKTYGLGTGVIHRMIDVEADYKNKDDNRSDEKTKFRVAPEYTEISLQALIMKGKIDSGKEHEENNHCIDVRTLIRADGDVSCGESPGGHSPEGMTEGIKQVHAS